MLVFLHLLENAKKREPDALSNLYKQFSEDVFKYVASRVPDRSVAEDLTSEIFFQMVEGIHKVRACDEISFTAWLFQIAYHVVVAYYRNKQKSTFIPLQSVEDSTFVSRLEDNPVRYLEEREQWSAVVCAINTLTEEQRQVVIYRFILEYDIETVARLIGKNVNAVKSLQFRAIQTLKRILKGKEDKHEISSW